MNRPKILIFLFLFSMTIASVAQETVAILPFTFTKEAGRVNDPDAGRFSLLDPCNNMHLPCISL